MGGAMSVLWDVECAVIVKEAKDVVGRWGIYD